MHTLPTPVISPFLFPLKMITPLDIGLKDWSIDFSPVMCREQILSRYHDWCFFLAIKEICNMNYFGCRYTNLLGSFFLVSMRVLVSTG